MKQEIIDIIRKFHLTNEIKTYDQCAEEILRLFNVGRSEQLAAFIKWYYKNDECPDLVTYEAAAERFLSR